MATTKKKTKKKVAKPARLKVNHRIRTSKKTSKKAPKKVSKKTSKKLKSKNSKKSKKTFKATKTYVAIVLDKSASMGIIQEEARTSFNDQLKKIQEESKNLDTRICLTVFNGDLDFVKFNEDVDQLALLEPKDYVPSGWTAFYDAVCTTIRKLEDLPDINESGTAVLMLIITDGQENSSKKYNGEDIASMISRLKGTDRWTFSVMGANINLEALSDSTGIDKSNMLKFAGNAGSVQRGTQMTNDSYGRYFKSRRRGVVQASNLYSDDDSVKDADYDSDSD